MSETNQKAVKKHRDAKRLEMGEEAYKSEQALKKKMYRAKKKLPPAPASTPAPESTPTPGVKEIQEIIDTLNVYLNASSKIDIPTVKALVEKQVIPAVIKVEDSKNCNHLLEAIYAAKVKIAESDEKTITKKTVIEQFNNVKKIYRYMFKKETKCISLDFLKDTKKVIKFIHSYPKWKADTTQIKQLSSISSVIKVLAGFEEAYAIYSKTSTKDAKAYSEQKGDIQLSEKEKTNILPWVDIENKIAKVKNMDVKDRALISIYTLLPPRRLSDIQLLTLTTSDTDLDNDYNYLLVDKKNNPKQLIYLKYKTAKVYKKQVIDIPANLATILKAHIVKAELESGDVVFGTAKGGYYTNFSTVLSNVFKKYTQKKLTVNLLRHSYITYYLSKKRTPNEKKHTALMMSHSPAVQALYDRIDLVSAEEFEKLD